MSKIIPGTNNIETAIEKKIDYNETLLAAWEKVKRVHTKSGADFKVLSKNFTGCSFHDNQFSLHSVKEKNVTVHGLSKYSGYISDDFRTHENATKDTPPERIIKETCIVPYYELNADEIENTINKRVEYYRKTVEELKKQKTLVAVALTEYKKGFAELIDKLIENAGGKNALYNLIIDNVDVYNCRY
jgi:hypothetical protein